MTNSAEGIPRSSESRHSFGYADRARAVFEADSADDGQIPAGSIDPTDNEVEAWAARTHAQRQAWVNGPTEEEKLRWAYRESLRRRERARSRQRSSAAPLRDDLPGNSSSARLRRDARLAAVGAVSQLLDLPFQILDGLINAGRDVEEAAPKGRRRVPLDEDDWD